MHTHKGYTNVTGVISVLVYALADSLAAVVAEVVIIIVRAITKPIAANIASICKAIVALMILIIIITRAKRCSATGITHMVAISYRISTSVRDCFSAIITNNVTVNIYTVGKAVCALITVKVAEMVTVHILMITETL